MISLNDIQAALGRIRGSIYLSPCARSETFSQSTANHVYLKFENLQRTGAFLIGELPHLSQSGAPSPKGTTLV